MISLLTYTSAIIVLQHMKLLILFYIQYFISFIQSFLTHFLLKYSIYEIPYSHNIFFCSILQRTMRDWAISLPRKNRGLCMGPNSGYRHHRQATEANKRSLRKLRNQVGLD